MGRLEGRTAVITGGSRGIGEAIARKFVAEGSRVFLLDLLEEEGRGLVADLEGGYGQGVARFFLLDVTSEEDWRGLAPVLADEGADILVNNAGIFALSSVEEMSLADWRRVFAVNVEGVFLACKYLVPILRAGSGRWKGGSSIVNLSSMAGIVGSAGTSAYSASKGAVRLLTKSLAVELSGGDQPLVRVNSVHPGVIETKMGAEVVDFARALGLGGDAGGRGAIEMLHPMNRLGLAEEVASVISFLASDEASYMTGGEVSVDGGAVAR